MFITPFFFPCIDAIATLFLGLQVFHPHCHFYTAMRVIFLRNEMGNIIIIQRRNIWHARNFTDCRLQVESHLIHSKISSHFPYTLCITYLSHTGEFIIFWVIFSIFLGHFRTSCLGLGLRRARCLGCRVHVCAVSLLPNELLNAVVKVELIRYLFTFLTKKRSLCLGT